MPGELLRIEGLVVGFRHAGLALEVVRDFSLTIHYGQCVGLVGESGCGKTMTALAILGLLPAGACIMGGTMLLTAAGDLTRLTASAWRQIRGRRIAAIFQEPGAALNPVLSVGQQIAEVVSLQRGASHRESWREAARLLDLVAIPGAQERLCSYPHQLSGGQKQRVMIALALASQPDLLLADEPTSALDVTVQAQILQLLQDLQRELQLAILMITHDFGVVAECCSRVVVMYAGQVVEEGAAAELIATPLHPYTRSLLAAAGADGAAAAIAGQAPDLARLPAGCAFHPRCPQAWSECSLRVPSLHSVGERSSRCFLYEEGRT